jgi:hypothetical protein
MEYNIYEDDTYSEVVDLEQGKSLSSADIVLEIQKNSEVQSNISLSDIYVNDPFAIKLQQELEWMKQSTKPLLIDTESIPIDSNSPLTMSICSTEEGKKPKVLKRLTYEEVEASLEKHHNIELHLTSELDLLMTYVKGQKHIFSQAHRITKQKFNLLMMPAIFITGSITVIGPFFNSISWSGWILSALNALLTVLIAMNNFMKFQANAELFLNISNQFEKLGISVEMSRNEYLFLEEKDKKHELLLDKRKETEKRIMDIQYNYNNLVIPYEIQLLNPIISHINIFSFFQKIEQYKKMLILKYKDVKNDILFVMNKWEKESVVKERTLQKQTEIDKLQNLLKQKEELKNDLLQANSHNVYAYIDKLFIREMQHSENYYAYHGVDMYLFCRPPVLERFQYGNPIVDNYLNFIFSIDNPDLAIDKI